MNTYELIRSRRKTLALELTREGQLIVRAPLRISRREIDAFVEKHKDWIVRHLAKQAARPTLPPPDAPERKLAQWLTGPQGQELVKNAGFGPLN